MACHNVGEVAERLRRVAVGSDVDVDSASPCGVALRAGLSKPPAKFLQGFDVAVGQDRRYHLTFFAVRPRDAHILLEFPFPAAFVPCALGAVAVPAGCVCVVVSSEELSGELRGCPGVMLFISISTPMVCCFMLSIWRAVFSVMALSPFGFVFPFGMCILPSGGPGAKSILLYYRRNTAQRYSPGSGVFMA